MLRRFTRRAAPHGAPPDDTISADVSYLLNELARVPRAELPDGAAREALAAAIRRGEIDGCYRPFGATQHNLTWAHLAPTLDPRVTIAQWLDWWRAGKDPIAERIAEQCARQAQAAAAHDAQGDQGDQGE